jgi:nitrite reductase/ring-hydroxylating ferredoxin subunit
VVEDNWNIHFNVNTQGEDMNFMAYVLDGDVYVRANVCPPCRSIGFSLEEAVLICDRCATTFEAQTGEGIQGACVDFPKASVPYQIDGGNIVMNSAELIAAYEDTLEPGLRGDGGNGGNNQSNGPIEALWIEPQVVGDTVSILQSVVEDNWNIHFNVNTQGEDMNFMAYVLDGEIYVRANVCPPCRSIGFSLDEAILICDRCATTFDSETGQGIQGACVDFPKAPVLYQIDNGNIVMNNADLVAAYEDTLEPG